VKTHETAPARIPRATFAAIVGERIRTGIIHGELEPGTQLNEVDLAARYGVSRGPVREALQRLIQEGLIRSEPHCGVFVPVMTDDDVVDIYLAREALETAAIRRIVGSPRARSTYADLTTIVGEMEKAESSGDWSALANVDLDFHTTLVSAAGSSRLERMFTTVIGETQLCMSVLTAADARVELVAEHRQIAEMIRDGDIDEALKVLRKHFHDGVHTLMGRQRAGNGSGQNG
jgi:DNA-binding GntR family transcriptional regulator